MKTLQKKLDILLDAKLINAVQYYKIMSQEEEFKKLQTQRKTNIKRIEELTKLI